MTNYNFSGLMYVFQKKLLQSIFLSLYIHLSIKCKWSTKYTAASEQATVKTQSIQQISLWENQTTIVIAVAVVAIFMLTIQQILDT